MVLAAALLAIAPQTVTITIAGATPRQAVERIAELTKQDLEVADSANKNTLVLRLTDAPVDEALARIAHVTSSKWVGIGVERVLTLDTERAKQEEKDEAALRAESVRKKLKEVTRGLSPTDEYVESTWATAIRVAEFMATHDQSGPSHARLQELAANKPAARLLRKILAYIDAETIADVEPGTIVVYSSRPNIQQRPFPRQVEKAIEEYAREAAAWSDAALSTLERFPQKFQEDPRAFAAIGKEPVETFLMSVRHEGKDRHYGVMLACFDQSGRQLASDGVVFSYHEATEQSVPGGLLGEAEAPADALELPNLHLNARLKTLPGGADSARELARWQARFVKCDTDEPIGYLAGRMLLSSVENADRQLVALLPDDVLEWQHSPFVGFAPRMTAGQFAATVTTTWNCTVGAEGGCTVVRPRFASRARANYLLRPPLARLLKSMTDQGTISFEAITRYAREQTGEAAFGESDYWISQHFATVAGNVDQSNPLMRHAEGVVRLLAAMTQQEIVEATSERGVIIRALGADAKKVIGQGVFGTLPFGQLRAVSRPVKKPHERRNDDPVWIDHWATAVLPHGVPASGTVHVKIEDSAMVAFKPLPTSDVRYPLAEAIERAGMWMAGQPRDYDTQLLQTRPMPVLTVTLRLGACVMDGLVRFVPTVDPTAWTTLDRVAALDRASIEQSLRDWRVRIGGG